MKQTKNCFICGKLLPLLIAAAFVSIIAAADLYAKYIVKNDMNSFGMNVAARYYATFDPQGGTITSGEATKIVQVGKVYGTLPTVEREGYDFLNWGGASLPGGYKQVEYIQTSGSEYFDIDWIPYGKQDVTINMAVSWSGSSWGVVFGAANDGDSIWYNCAMGKNGSNPEQFWHHVCGSGNICKYPIVQNKKYEYSYHYVQDAVAKKASLTVAIDSETPKTENNLSGNIEPGETLSIMTGHYGTRHDHNFSGKLYSFSIKEGDTTVVELIPCIDDNNVAGLYDVIGKKFYGNSSGSGEVKRGDIVGVSVTEDTIVTNPRDHVIEARWEPKQNKIILDANDTEGSTRAKGNVPEGKIDVLYDATLSELPELERGGYDFNGWYDDNGNLHENGEKLKLLSDMTLRAKWTARQYEISFNVGTESVAPDSRQVTFDKPYGAEASLPVPERENFRFVHWTTNGLPSGYQPAEYVESDGSGTQYIDTDWSPKNKKEVTINVTASYKSGWGVLFGAADASDKTDWFNCAMGDGRIWHHIFTSQSICQYTGLSANTVYNITFHYVYPNHLDVTVNGVKKEFDSLDASHCPPDTLSIMYGRYGSGHKFPLNGKLYAFSLYEGDVPIMDMTPCYNGSGVYGMYDSVTGHFYTSSGSKAFSGKAKSDAEGVVYDDTPVIIAADHALNAVWEPLALSSLTFNMNYINNTDQPAIQKVIPER